MDRLSFLQLLISAPLGTRQDEPTAEMRYHSARDLLIRGKRFERAAELLRLARKQAQEEARIASALGCALVSRVASLSYAALFAYSFEADQRNYPKELEAWARGKDDPESDYYQKSRPTPPPAQLILRTKDDEQPFRLRPKELAVKAAALATEAREAFGTARKLAKTPEAQAEAAYIEGWGLLVLQGYAVDTDPETGEAPFFPDGVEMEEGEDKRKPLFPRPDTETIQKAFHEATEKGPTMAAYWQSLGDVENDDKKAEPLYRKSLKCNPRNSSLWYRLYEREMLKRSASQVSLAGGETDTETLDVSKALADLRMAARYDPANAWYAYEEALVAFKQTRYTSYTASRHAMNAPRPSDLESAALWKKQREEYGELQKEAATKESREAAKRSVSLVERGNQSPDWRFPDYLEPVPRLLAAARGYNAWTARQFVFFTRVRELARALTGYALYLAAEEQDNLSAIRACRAATELGQRLEGDWPTRESYLGDSSFLSTLVGHAIVAIGLKTLVDVERTSGSPNRVMQAQAKLNEFNSRVKAHRAVLQRSMANWKPYNYY